MKRTVAAAAVQRVPRSGLSKRRNRNMKPKTAAPEPLKPRSFAEPFVGSASDDGFRWPPVEVPTRLRTRTVDSTLPARYRSVKPHAVLGVNVATGPRGITSLRPRRPVPFPLSRFPSSHLFGVLRALGTDPRAVATPVGTPVTKIQSSDCSAFAAVETPSVIQGSQVADVAEVNTQLLQQNVKLHPVLGVFVRTRRRASRCSCPCQCSRVPELLCLFPGGNSED